MSGMNLPQEQPSGATRPVMDVDIVCVGFGPATAGFLTTLARAVYLPDGTPAFESRVAPGLPPQVIAYERADDIGFGVSGVVTRARALRASFNDQQLAQVPMAAPVKDEKVVYLLDPHGASRRPLVMRMADQVLRAAPRLFGVEHEALELPYTPDFLHKQDGWVLSIGQFLQWAGQEILMTGAVQIWPGSPVAEPLVEGGRVAGVRLADQGVDAVGNATGSYMPGLEVRAALTVIGDGPVGPVGRKIDQLLGVPAGFERNEWAVGMKFVVELPEGVTLEPGTVIHTIGYPEPEIFGFFYVHPGSVASVGIFVPSWFDSPVRTAYRYLQHHIQHPYLWRYLKGGRLRSWGAKSLLESGKRGEPFLAGEGYARIGEGSGSTNVLTGSGVDEAWMTGKLLAEAVIELMREGLPFTRENLEKTYVRRRRASWLELEAQAARKARDGFQKGVLRGLAGMALAGLTQGRLNWPARPKPTWERIGSIEQYFADRIPPEEIARIRAECARQAKPLHDALLERAGWPPIAYDGQLLVSHQDALLMGGKVQAPPGYADHVVFLHPALCKSCRAQICVEICSGQAIQPGADGVPSFDREKCVHCGACLWNCVQETPQGGNIDFRAGAGGLHSSEN